MLRVSASLALIAVFNVLLAGQQATEHLSSPESWKEYVDLENGFAIRLPAAPDIWKDPTHPSTHYTLHVTSDTIINVLVMREVKDCPALLTYYADSARQLGGPSSVRDISVDGHQGFEIVPSAEGDSGYTRSLCANEKFYTLAASWLRGDPKPPVVTRILDSFRILKPAGEKQAPERRK